jgi:predicted nucleic acid-binding protein
VPFVLDASIAAVWAFDDEDHPDASAALSRLVNDHGVVPALWRFELGNTLLVNERRQRIEQERTQVFLREIAKLPIIIDSSPDESAIFALARRRRLTFYDATYLELALRLGAPLVTLDAALATAALAEQVLSIRSG